MKAESPRPRYGGSPAMALLILVLVAAGGCGGAERPAALTAGTVSPTTGVATTTTRVNATPVPETTQGTQPAGTSVTVPTSVPVSTEPSSAATTTQVPATTTVTTAGPTAPSTVPVSTTAGGTTTTEAPPVTEEPTTTTTRAATTTTPSTTTTTRAPTTTTEATTTTTEPAVDASLLYTENCVTCHNESGEGGTGADLRMSTLPLAEITSVIVNGRGKFMPGWADILTAAEIEAVARYVKALQEG